MTESLARDAGSALTWRALQLGGTKGIFLLRTLILARLLSPDDFGLFAIATAAVGFLMSTTDFGMVPALVHRSETKEAQYHGAWTVGLARGIAVSAVLMAGAPGIAALFGEPRAVAVLRLIALKPLIDASASIRIAALLRDLQYRRLALVNLLGVMVEAAVSLALAADYGVWALVMGTLIGGVGTVVFSYIVAPYRPRFLLDANVIRPLTDYGRWIFLTALVTVAASFLTQVVISRQLGAFELGLYVLAAKLAYLPYEMANQVVGEVAFPLFARIQQDRVRVAAAFRSMLLGVITFLLPLYVLLISMAGWVVRDGLGERWTGTESLIQLLALVGIANLFGDACGPLFRGLGYPKWSTWVELLQSILVVGLLWGLTGQYGAPGAAVAWLIGVIVAQTLNFVLARRLVERPLAGTWRPILVVAAAAGAGAATTMPLGYLAPGLARLVAALLLAGAVTAIVVWTCDRRFNLGVGSILSHTFPRFTRVVAPALGQ